MGLEGSAVVNLVNAIVPLYITIALGYVLSKFKVVAYDKHYAGIVTFCFKLTIPALVFQLVATNDPYTLNLRLVGADTLSKVVVLLVLSLGYYRWPTAEGVAWVYAYFSLATMSNTVLVGIPLVTALYPGTEKDLTALIFMQSLLWFCVCIFVLELYKVHVEKNANEEDGEQELELGSGHSIVDLVKDVRMTRSESQSSCPSEDEGSSTKRSTIDQGKGDSERPAVAALSSVTVSTDATENGYHVHHDVDLNDEGCYDSKDVTIPVVNSSNSEPPVHGRKLSKLWLARRMLKTLAVNFLWSPVVWASVLGLAYALLNFKFNRGRPLPAILKTSVSLFANCVLGVSMFMLGMHIAARKKLFPGGTYRALWGTVIRFLVSPAVMAVASLIAGLRGRMFRFAVLQAMIPQSISTFIFACNYHVHEDTFSTAVWFQTLIFFPFAIALYSLLEAGS
ncbi:hypothetical protein R1sor_023627 [Riccia sorocarpa]|uniref:Auxin efflux carrier component n=1 Tax=Riccia sorocarpa TaxID=122646 RepID=A0ABD3GQ08_9MARC